jgi:hypothetical protein
MTVAVTLRLDDTSAARVTRFWEKLYAEGLDPALLLPDTEPRIVLAEYPDDVGADAVTVGIDRLATCWPAMPVRVTGLTVIGGYSPVVSLAVAPTTALLALHGRLHTALGDLSSDARCRPGCWTPGIVVSEWAVSVADAVRSLLPSLVEPFGGRVVGLDLIRRPSGTVVDTWDLLD